MFESDPPKNDAKPLNRFWARFMDNVLFGIIIWKLVIPLIPSLEVVSPKLISLLILFAWIFMEAFVFVVWGTTPGKAILNINLRRVDGREVTYYEMLERSFEVWIKGLGAGLPVVSLITLSYCYFQLDRKGICSWDGDNGYVVTHGEMGAGRMALALIIIVGIKVYLVASFVGAFDR